MTSLPTVYRWRLMFARHLRLGNFLRAVAGWAGVIAIAGMAAIGVLGN